MRVFLGFLHRLLGTAPKGSHVNSAELHSTRISDSSFIRHYGERHSLCSYKIIEDDFRRISRSSKISFVGLSTFLVCPGAFALLTTPSSVVNDLIQHQFKLSSATLSWLSATVFVFHLMRFNTSVFTIAWSLVGLLGSTTSLIMLDYSSIYAYACLLSSYTAFALVTNPYGLPVFRRSGSRWNPVGTLSFPLRNVKSPYLPVCVAKPVTWTALLNIALVMGTALRKSHVENDLLNTSPEEFIRWYEKQQGIGK